MRHVILTCKKHTNLRWSTKEIAVFQGKYTGIRSIFFLGEPVLDADGKPQMHSDGSGLMCNDVAPIRDDGGQVTGYRVIYECTCSPTDLVVAPEDDLVKRHG
jgi:hypothetical protein